MKTQNLLNNSESPARNGIENGPIGSWKKQTISELICMRHVGAFFHEYIRGVIQNR